VRAQEIAVLGVEDQFHETIGFARSQRAA
jgi:hypothetical protein